VTLRAQNLKLLCVETSDAAAVCLKLKAMSELAAKHFAQLSAAAFAV
jgi:hypothetical protein